MVCKTRLCSRQKSCERPIDAIIVNGSEHGYRPKPVRRKEIPKPYDPSKARPLGIPCMAYIEPRKNSKGKITSYRLVVSEGFKPNGDRIKRCTVWTPPRPNMTAKQMEKEATSAAIKFEEQIKIGLRIDNDIKFHEYANYVLGIKEQAGVRPTTLDRYIEMLPRINKAIDHLSLTKIRPEHLNEFYRDLLTNSVCKNKSRAYSKGELLRTLERLDVPNSALARETGLAPMTITAPVRGHLFCGKPENSASWLIRLCPVAMP